MLCSYVSADWVCVMEMDWFEMTLRLCNNAQCEGDYQKVRKTGGFSVRQ